MKVGNERQATERGIELNTHPARTRGTAIVRAGHPALDAALAAEASAEASPATVHALGADHAAATVRAMREACRVTVWTGADTRPVADAPARTQGSELESMSLSVSRGRGPAVAVHVAAVRKAMGPDGVVRELRIWRELAEQSCN